MFLVIDFGGTWIKGALITKQAYLDFLLNKNRSDLTAFLIKADKVPSPFCNDAEADDVVEAVISLVNKISSGITGLEGIAVSTGGIINYHGTAVDRASDHFSILTKNEWKAALEKKYGCSLIIINDADAAASGMSELGYFSGDKTIGVMVLGTGIGFTVWRNGRRWRPGGVLTLLGSIQTPAGSYNEMASVSKLAESDEKNDLLNVLRNTEHKEVLSDYFQNLVKIINSAAIIYNLDEIYISGGLVNAAVEGDFDLLVHLKPALNNVPPELTHPVEIKIVKEGNLLQLLGAGALIIGETVCREQTRIPVYDEIETEIPYDKNVMLQEMNESELSEILWKAEEEAGKSLKKSLPLVAEVAAKVAESISKGGRLIYAGAGTSGRIAAMDAVEIPCTYGLPKNQIFAIIAGGVADAAMDIESGFEEDASSVPEMLLTDISDKDVVIGISASGSAYFVQSALAYAKFRGAYTVFIRNARPGMALPYCHTILPLYSNFEVVAGSTRMKAGTATKKILNFISSIAMIKLGKVHGAYMIDMACLNSKLTNRAKKILEKIYGIKEQETLSLLSKNEMSLKKVIQKIEKKNAPI